MPDVSLRARTDDDLDVLYRLTADLDTWEERNPAEPAPMTRARFDALLVGTASLFGVDSFARHAEVGINLLPEARGRGVGTEAMRPLVEFAFVRRNLSRIHLQAIASNTAALRSYEKAGFVVEGRLRKHAWVRGAYEDIVLMGILRSEDAPSS